MYNIYLPASFSLCVKLKSPLQLVWHSDLISTPLLLYDRQCEIAWLGCEVTVMSLFDFISFDVKSRNVDMMSQWHGWEVVKAVLKAFYDVTLWLLCEVTVCPICEMFDICDDSASVRVTRFYTNTIRKVRFVILFATGLCNEHKYLINFK